MPKVRYIGPFDEVEVTAAGRIWPCRNGDEIDVPDDVAEGLLSQDIWEAPESRKAKPAREGANTEEKA
jgi:hypothetical protein